MSPQSRKGVYLETIIMTHSLAETLAFAVALEEDREICTDPITERESSVISVEGQTSVDGLTPTLVSVR